MASNVALVTGSSGLIGSEAVAFLDTRGWRVVGVDNNMRADFFGVHGDTTWNLKRLLGEARHFEHITADIREQSTVANIVKRTRPSLIFHCAAQPSHDLAAARPFDDFSINASGTLNLLEAARAYCPETCFVFMSTNKVYGDAPNELPLVEHETRYDYADRKSWHGIDEKMRIDASMHSLFGVSKAAADLLVQEYGRYFGIPTCCFRGGCLTGSHHSGAELHGFLSYLARAVRDGLSYKIYGYNGKQVRDNIHAADVCEAMLSFYASPKVGAVYNLGGGRDNSISVVEAIEWFEEVYGRPLEVTYVDQARKGDHICYISDIRRFQADYPMWEITRGLDAIFDEFRTLKMAASS